MRAPNQHPWQFKESKSWGLFWSCHLNSTANSAHLAHLAHFTENRLNWQCRLAGSSKMARRILIFLIAKGAKPSIWLKSIAT